MEILSYIFHVLSYCAIPIPSIRSLTFFSVVVISFYEKERPLRCIYDDELKYLDKKISNKNYTALAKYYVLIKTFCL